MHVHAAERRRAREGTGGNCNYVPWNAELTNRAERRRNLSRSRDYETIQKRAISWKGLRTTLYRIFARGIPSKKENAGSRQFARHLTRRIADERQRQFLRRKERYLILRAEMLSRRNTRVQSCSNADKRYYGKLRVHARSIASKYAIAT